MYNPIDRTTVQVEDNKYKLYSSPLFYKNSEGGYSDIDLTFNNNTSTIGNISLMDKGIVSVGKRKDNNPYKVVGIRPDNCRDGSKQLEFSLINVELNDAKEDLNVEDNLEIILRPNKVYQLIKIDKNFGKCKIEFDIHLKNLEIQNPKYSTSKTEFEYKFNITNIGSLNGSDALGMYNSYEQEETDIQTLDCYIGQIADNYITTGEYSIEEEFGDSDLSNYTLEKMYPYGGSAYLKDCIIFAVKSKNIEKFSDIIVKQICDLYGLETIHEDNKNGQYFTKDGKKVASYYSVNNTFLSFFNTTEIPSSIKTLFKRKTFQSTSFLDITIDSLKNDIESRLNKDLTIKVDTDYYIPANDAFYIKINNKSFTIGTPIAFDKNYNNLDYKTTHTLKDNKDGTYRYTKWLLPEQALKVNSAKYIDVNISVGNTEDAVFRYNRSLTTGDPKDATNLAYVRDQQGGVTHISHYGGEINPGSPTYPSVGNSTTPIPMCGEFQSRSTSGGSQGSALTTTKKWRVWQSHYYFNTSGISDTVTDAKYKFKTCVWDSTALGGGANFILLKSEYDNDIPNIFAITGPSGGSSHRGNFNNFTGHTTSWGASDVTEYSALKNVSNIFSTAASSTPQPASSDFADDNVSLNATAKTNIKNDDEFSFCKIEHDVIYSNSHTAGVQVGGITTVQAKYLYGYQVDSSTTADRPYLEVTTGTAPATPTENATFFGANF